MRTAEIKCTWVVGSVGSPDLKPLQGACWSPEGRTLIGSFQISHGPWWPAPSLWLQALSPNCRGADLLSCSLRTDVWVDTGLSVDSAGALGGTVPC